MELIMYVTQFPSTLLVKYGQFPQMKIIQYISPSTPLISMIEIDR